MNTETASTFEPAGADAGSGTGVPGQPAGAQLSLAGEGGTAPGLAWGILMLLGLTVVCGLVVGIYAMGKLRGRPGGAHRHGG